MPEAKNGNPGQFLDLLLDYFVDGTRWTQGDLDDGRGGRCLVGAIHHLRRKHQIPSAAAESLLQEALPRGYCHLALFNDSCASIAELRALIVNARTLAVAAAAQRPKLAAAVRLGRWRVSVRLKRERTASAAAVAERPTTVLRPKSWVRQKGIDDRAPRFRSLFLNHVAGAKAHHRLGPLLNDILILLRSSIIIEGAPGPHRPKRTETALWREQSNLFNTPKPVNRCPPLVGEAHASVLCVGGGAKGRDPAHCSRVLEDFGP